MNIFGIVFSSSDLYLLGIAGILVMFLLGIRVPETVKRTNAAKSEFRASFDDAILNIEENPDCPIAQFSRALHNQHLAAIIKYRRFVPFWKRSSFDKAVKSYKKAHDIASPAIW